MNIDNKTLIVIAVIIVLLLNAYRNYNRLNRVSRKLWVDHVLWTREFLNATLLGTELSGLKSASADRLMKNQEDIGKMYGSYYGVTVGNQLTTLLKEHINQAVDVVKSLGTDALNDKVTAWKINAKKIGSYVKKYSGIDMTQMMLNHLDLTTAETISIQKSDFIASITNFDAVLKEAYMMADAMAFAMAKTNFVTMVTTLGTLPCCVANNK